MHTDFCNCSLWEEPFCPECYESCPECYESRWSDRSRPCPSAAFFHRSRAASSLGLRLVGAGGRLISPINTFVSASLMNLGDLTPQASRRAIGGRGLVLGGINRPGGPRRPRGLCARFLSA